MNPDLDLPAKIRLWQQKNKDGTITIEEMRENIQHLRAGRQKAIEVAVIKKERSAAPKEKKVKASSASGLLADFKKQMEGGE